MSIHDRETVFEETFKVQLTGDGTPYICLGKNFMEKAGHDPDNGVVPDELSLHYHDGGQKDGVLETDLKVNNEQ